MNESTDILSRRSFLARSSKAAAVAMTAATYIPRHVFGANERVRVAVLGVHGRGKSHIRAFMELDNAEVVALCDPDMQVLQERARDFKEQYDKKVKLIQDFRRILDDKKIDAVSIASTNHWHSLMTIWACQAGKDVYVEKPMSHNIFEGRKAVEAARKYDRVVQHGTQSRGSEGAAKEIAAVQSGKYGKLVVSKGYASKPRWSIGYKANKKPPQHLDYNLWLGPAPTQPYHENLVHYNWHWFWDTGNGEIGNQGVHQMDVARWAIPNATLPGSVWSLGGRFAYDDQGETPNTQMAVMDFGEALLIFEVCGLVENPSKSPRKVTNEFFTTEGKIARGKFYPKTGGAPELLEDLGGSVQPGGIFGNFINAVRNHNVTELNADVLEGHYSSALCHLANISYVLGKRVPFSKRPDSLLENEIVFDTFQALEKNVSWGNKLNLHDMTYKMGQKLDFNAQEERFTNNEEANRLLTRVYREPFIVPENV